MPISPTCLQMGTGANEHLGKRVPQVSCAHFPQIFQIGSKFGENGHRALVIPR